MSKYYPIASHCIHLCMISIFAPKATCIPVCMICAHCYPFDTLVYIVTRLTHWDGFDTLVHIVMIVTHWDALGPFLTSRALTFDLRSIRYNITYITIQYNLGYFYLYLTSSGGFGAGIVPGQRRVNAGSNRD